VQKELVSSSEVFEGDPHYAVEMLVQVVDAGFELLPENFLFFLRDRRRARCLGIRRLGEAYGN